MSNDQRQVIYQQRRELMDSQDISKPSGLREEVVYDLVAQHIPPQSLIEQWDIGGLELSLQNEFASSQALGRWLEEDEALDEEGLAACAWPDRGRVWSEEGRWQEAVLICDWSKNRSCCKYWISDGKASRVMDQLRQGIHKSLCEKQPKQEFKRESFSSFSLLQNIKFDVVRMLSRMQIENPQEIEAQERLRRAGPQKMNFQHSQSTAATQTAAQPKEAPKAETTW